MIHNETIIFDLDDTLIDTSHLYWTVKKEIIEKVSTIAKIDYLKVDHIFEEFENKNINIYGHNPERYSISTKNLCDYYAINNKKDIIDIAKKIYLNQPKLIPYAYELLEWCKIRFNIVLITRGTEKVQMEKIESSGLNKYFYKNTIRVVPYKNKTVFLKFIKELNTLPERCWVIGDSIKSDIIPGVEAGTKVIRYNYTHHTYEWVQDKKETNYSYITVDSLEEIQAVLEDSITINKK